METEDVPQELDFHVLGDELWALSSGLVSSVSKEAAEMIRREMPDLEDAFPVSRHFVAEYHLDPEGWLAVRVTYETRLSMIVTRTLPAQDVMALKRLIPTAEDGLHSAQIAALGPEWVSYNRFTYVGPCQGRRLSSSHIDAQFEWWLNSVVVTEVLERNRQRVLRAVPPPPSYDVDRIRRALWVLESEEECRQGSAFEFGQRGLATCAHSVGSATIAFRSSDPTKRYPVEVISKHDALDLALLRGPEMPTGLSAGDPGALVPSRGVLEMAVSVSGATTVLVQAARSIVVLEGGWPRLRQPSTLRMAI